MTTRWRCPNVAIGGHDLVITYRRPWRRLFRKETIIRCWYCDLWIRQP